MMKGGTVAVMADVKAAIAELEQVTEDLRVARQNRRQLERDIARLERKRDALRAGRRATRPSETLDPHSQAGSKNVELMRGVFRDGRCLTAAEATKRAESKPGHQVWAIRALLAEGQIEETGRMIDRSKQYRWVGERRRRRTRMEPGA